MSCKTSHKKNNKEKGKDNKKIVENSKRSTYN